MRVVSPPEPTWYSHASVFLAGGITGCPDWQSELIERHADVPVTVFNPRCAVLPASPEEQIKWEVKALHDAAMISFWFAAETVQSITLFELGYWLHSYKPLVIGVHPSYPRKLDVEVQTKLARPTCFPPFRLAVGWEEFLRQWRKAATEGLWPRVINA